MEKEKNDVIIILSIGKYHTQIYADGRVYADGIRSVDFHKEGGENPKLSATAGVLPIHGDGSNNSLNGFLKIISDEIQKYVSESKKATAADECDSSAENKA